MNMKQAALEFSKAMEFFATGLDVETEMDKVLAIPSLSLIHI